MKFIQKHFPILKSSEERSRLLDADRIIDFIGGFTVGVGYGEVFIPVDDAEAAILEYPYQISRGYLKECGYSEFSLNYRMSKEDYKEFAREMSTTVGLYYSQDFVEMVKPKKFFQWYQFKKRLPIEYRILSADIYNFFIDTELCTPTLIYAMPNAIWRTTVEKVRLKLMSNEHSSFYSEEMQGWLSKPE